jgi:hypothetical protein
MPMPSGMLEGNSNLREGHRSNENSTDASVKRDLNFGDVAWVYPRNALDSRKLLFSSGTSVQ